MHKSTYILPPHARAHGRDKKILVSFSCSFLYFSVMLSPLKWLKCYIKWTPTHVVHLSVHSSGSLCYLLRPLGRIQVSLLSDLLTLASRVCKSTLIPFCPGTLVRGHKESAWGSGFAIAQHRLRHSCTKINHTFAYLFGYFCSFTVINIIFSVMHRTYHARI